MRITERYDRCRLGAREDGLKEDLRAQFRLALLPRLLALCCHLIEIMHENERVIVREWHTREHQHDVIRTNPAALSLLLADDDDDDEAGGERSMACINTATASSGDKGESTADCKADKSASLL